MRPLRAPLAAPLALVAILLGSCDGDPLVPQVGGLRISVVTTGVDRDPNGYRVSLNEGRSLPVAIDSAIGMATMSVSGLPPRTYRVELEDLADNCAVSGDNPRRVVVSEDAMASVFFTVNCRARVGALRVTTVTSGPDQDEDGYLAVLDGSGPGTRVGQSATTVISGIREGFHTVELTDVARNCSVTPAGPRPVTIAFDDTTDIAFSIQCTAVAVLRVITATSGIDLDADGYAVVVRGMGLDTAAAASAADTVTFSRLVPGSYEIRLEGLSSNCRLIGQSPRPVTLTGGAVGSVTFDIECTAARELAFAGEHNGNVDIYRVKSNGAGLVRLTTHGATDTEPAWSPDGSRIAFTSYRHGVPEIYVMNADGTNPTRLTSTTGGNYSPAWSPDGGKIAFASQRDGNAEIYVMNADGTSQLRRTNNEASDTEPAWSPDGGRIAFSSTRNGNWQIHLMNADGSGVQPLAGGSGVDVTSPAWSPDGGKIAFGGVTCIYYYYYYYYSCYSYSYDVFVMNADGSNVTRLTSMGNAYGEPAWSPDGRHIAFTCCDGPRLVAIMDADGRNIAQVVTGLAASFSPAWRP